MSGGRPVFDIPDTLSVILYNGGLFGVPAPILIAAVACLGAHFLLDRTVIGRSLYLIGGNPRAAEVAGIPVARRLVLACVFVSTLAALRSLMLTARRLQSRKLLHAVQGWLTGRRKAPWGLRSPRKFCRLD